MNNYHIITFDGGGYMHFFTTAKDSKEALVNLQTNSSDFRNICHEDRDINIDIKKVSKKH